MTILIDGKKIARDIRRQVKQKIQQLETKPRFVVVQVGENPASTIYVQNKLKACRRVGIETVNVNLDSDITEDDLRGLIEGFNNSKSYHGILVQLPLPEHIRLEPVIEEIHPNKDVDGLHPLNVGRLTVRSQIPYLHPCTPFGIVHMLDTVYPKKGSVSGLQRKKIAVIGQSLIVGRPLAIMLQNEGATVAMCDKFTRNLEQEVRGADIIISATGVVGLVNEELVAATGKEEVTVIDAGIARLGDKIVGDADLEIYDKVHAITPVPGGVGPVTVAFLIRNILKAYCIQHNLPIPTFH
ncbi:MAG: bifunctional 5,10-methylenetetrahydrofolate dehydrogenase/5,10-methenyltetrahydrofolate cyclohydrolase [Deltaproteobacteria bacterium]|nr:bifunctional 5,10-methylenetetrahydrofolate dehydrogenase/5,10-methenyltetrahydrofolate cyclohydrolase [Deltaproteobacteria bacterium]